MNFHGIWDSEVFSLCKTGLEIIRNRLARFSFFDSLRANQEFHASLCIFGNPGIGPVVLSALLDGLEPLYQYGDIVLIEIKQALYTIFPEFIHSVTEFLRSVVEIRNAIAERTYPVIKLNGAVIQLLCTVLQRSGAVIQGLRTGFEL